MNENTTSQPVDPSTGDTDALDPAQQPEQGPGADLAPEEAADVMETRGEAHRIKQTRDDQQDESLINLDPGD